MGFPYDVSSIFFIATGNDRDAINPILRDRLEIIELPGYTEDEQIALTSSHVLPRLLAEYAISESEVCVSLEAVAAVVRDFSAEPGLRGVEHRLRQVLRRGIREYMQSQACVRVDRARLHEWIAAERAGHEPIGFHLTARS